MAKLTDLSTRARKAYARVGEAGDKLDRAQRRLDEMREDGARGVEVQAERVRQARRAEKDAIREAASAMNDYEKSCQLRRGLG